MKTVNNTVAAIIPTYNRLATLGRALESVYTQSRQADEVCVVDDGSIDGTEEFVKQQYPDTIYIKQKAQQETLVWMRRLVSIYRS